MSKNQNITVIMPIGGTGERFKIINKKLEKPLIRINKIPLFIISLTSLKKIKNIKEVVIVARKKILKDIKEECQKSVFLKNKKFIFISLNRKTKSPIHTLIKTTNILKKSARVICLDNDLYFKSINYVKLINNKIPDAVVPYFLSSKSNYSYIKSYKNRVLSIKEKKVISRKAVAGSYFFQNGKDLLRYLNQAIKQRKNYISDVLNIYLKNNKKVYCSKTDYYRSFGTPEDLNKSLKNFYV